MRFRLLRELVLCVSLGSAGCATLQRRTRAVAAPSGAQATVVRDIAIVDVDSLQLHVYAHYESIGFMSSGPFLPLIPVQLHGAPPIPPLRMEILVVPRGHVVRFAPYASRVRLADGQLLSAVSAVHTGPIDDQSRVFRDALCRYRLVDDGGGRQHLERHPLQPGEDIVVSAPTCFMLEFPVDDKTDHFTFDLLLAGLTVNDRVLDLPRVAFRPVSAWRWKFPQDPF